MRPGKFLRIFRKYDRICVGLKEIKVIMHNNCLTILKNRAIMLNINYAV